MTSIEWLFNELWEAPKDKLTWYYILKQAKEMHKQEIIDAFFEGAYGGDNISGEQYYQETFGQGITLQNNSESKGITELSDESWEGCDGCTEQDEIMYKNGYVKGYNAANAELPKEISDEEIEKESYPEFPDRIWLHGDGRKLTSSQTTSDKWKEYQDWLNEPPEISDEEIKKSAIDIISKDNREGIYFTDDVESFIQGAKWYREQLKQL